MSQPPHRSGDQPLRIGRYLVLEQLGEGGMGVVYLAEQTVPLRRLVALKILKAGMDTRQVLARFAAERQALALMDHPNIAQILDAGETPEGRPYFVMQHVAGETIDRYCHRHRLDLRRRVELLISVCNAVQHAHDRAIVHRDLKPSNILVTEIDDQPVAKIIDFGIAKSISTPLTGQTLFTHHGDLMGTPEYMSPEQAVPGPEGVDARADVYSLGAVLYELIAGLPPFAPDDLRGGGVNSIQKMLQEVDPPLPSRRFAAAGRHRKEIARACGLDGPALERQLRGELDWICGRALEKSRLRRYSTAHDLALDLQRYLDGEPLQAGRRSMGRRFLRGIRRKGRLLATTALLSLAIVLAGVVTWQWTWQRTASRPALTPTRLVPLTAGQTNDSFPSFSPDGTRVVFVSDRGGQWDLWSMHLETGVTTRLTRTAQVETDPVWSPDGRSVAFAQRREGQPAWDVWVMEVSGEDLRRLAENASAPTWSPDGLWVAYTDESGGWFRLACTATGEPRITRPITPREPGFYHRYPGWSPDGTTIVYKRSPGGEAGQLMLVPSQGGDSHPLTRDGEDVANSWARFTPDGQHVVYSSDRGGTTNLWRIPLAGGSPQRMTGGTGSDIAPAIAPDGRSIIFTVEATGSRLLRIDRPTGAARVIQEFPRSSVWFPAVSGDGQRIVLVEKIPGSPWRLAALGGPAGGLQAIPVDSSDVMGPRLHPDGSSLIFFTWPAGLRVGQVGLDGGGLQWLTGEDQEAKYPDISPDGSRLAYVDGQGQIVVRSLSGSEVREVGLGTTPTFSPDGRMLALARSRSYEGGIGLVPAAGGKVRWLTSTGSWPTWMPDGQAVAYIDAGTDGFQLGWSVPVAGGSPRLLTTYRWQTGYSPFVIDPASGDLITTDGMGDTRTLWLAEFF